MSLTTNVPVFPGFAPGRSWLAPVQPIRGPGWSVKKTPRWNNFKQEAVSGRTTLVKYFNNPLWGFEWTYEVILDNPQNINNAFFSGLPVPYTDYQMLVGFYNAMQGMGNEFLFQPHDSKVGTVGGTLGSGSINQVSITGNIVTLTNTTLSGFDTLYTLNAKGGLSLVPSGLTGAAFLNGQTLPILQVTPNSIICGPFTHANYGPTSDSGDMFIGQPLTVDANNNAELVHIVGGYPNPVTVGSNTMTQVTESVQVINSTGLLVYGGGASIAFTLNPANSVAPYSGLVVSFASAPATPLLASFPYYYLCRFSEDTMEFENFMTMLWACKTFKFEQVRV